ncbi:MAG: hypothetical protein ACPGJR_11500 [Akkermansiaceae bacterium]
MVLSGWSLVRSFSDDQQDTQISDKGKSGADIEAKIEEVLNQREGEMVAQMKPRVLQMFADRGTAPKENPETFEDLFQPLIKIFEMMQVSEWSALIARPFFLFLNLS